MKCLKIMTRVLTPLPNLLAILPQEENNRDEDDGDEAEQTVTPVQAEGGEHSICKQREAGTERGPEEVVAGVDGRNVVWVCVAEVVEDCGELVWWRLVRWLRVGAGKVGSWVGRRVRGYYVPRGTRRC